MFSVKLFTSFFFRGGQTFVTINLNFFTSCLFNRAGVIIGFHSYLFILLPSLFALPPSSSYLTCVVNSMSFSVFPIQFINPFFFSFSLCYALSGMFLFLRFVNYFATIISKSYARLIFHSSFLALSFIFPFIILAPYPSF